MAFQWQTFKTRALTAIVFVVVMMGGLLWNEWSFFLLFSVVHFGAWIEFQKLIERIHKDYQKVSLFHRYGIMGAGWCLLLFFTNGELQLFSTSLSLLGLWLGLFLVVAIPLSVFISREEGYLKNLAYSFVGLIYISLSIALFTELRYRWAEEDDTLNLVLPLLLIFTIWINDTMAYIVGSLIGKTPLSPISPKKTWEGTIGGAILAVLIMSLLAYVTGLLPLMHTAVIATLASIAGTYGDLFESKLKRLAGVKDSGQIMPGHGGFLDRFDSLLFAGTICWVYIALFV
ncbi:MAG TPA: phosphatidate cytidylyltransferase [Chitinophagaceae bacterium]|nr:phosphatidate cytidylyltransferase [Chitinophagaceae bacterium]